jgi:hypothetical protein
MPLAQIIFSQHLMLSLQTHSIGHRLPCLTPQRPTRGVKCATKRIVVILNIGERSCSIEIVLPPKHEG